MTGLYFRDVIRHVQALSGQMATQSAQIEAQGEVMDLILRRLRRLEEEMTALTESLGRLQQEMAALTQPVKALQAEVTAWSQPMKALTAKPTIHEPLSSGAEQTRTIENPLSPPQSGQTEMTEEQPSSPPVERPKIAILCRSLGDRCGIAEYASFLAQRLGVSQVASVADLPLDTDIVFVQYEISLYPKPADIINEVTLIKPPTIVVVDAHTLSPDLADELRWHAIVGVKRNLYPGTTRLSHIQQLPVPTEDEPVHGIHLGCFGFAFPAKRYELVIQLAQRLGVGATILAAHNNATPQLSELSASYIARLKSLAEGDIEVIDEFLPVPEVIRQLRRCSHLISCMEDNGAQSGSLRIMAAAGRPLISLRTEPAREVGAILVDDLDAVTIEFLGGCRQLPQPYDGIADYHVLLQRLAWAKELGRQILHSDALYLDDPKQMKRLDWLRQNITGRAIDIGIGNGFSTNYIKAMAGVEIRPDRLAYAGLRYPHIDFRPLDARVQALPGFDTVVFGEIVEHMPLAEAKQMVALWAEREPARILITTPNAGKPDYDDDLVHNPEHVWEPTEELVYNLVPTGYRATITTSSGDDFLLVDMEKEG
jgi:hypothetical protein